MKSGIAVTIATFTELRTLLSKISHYAWKLWMNQSMNILIAFTYGFSINITI